MSRGLCSIVGFEVHRKVSEDAHWYLPNFPPDFGRHIENQKTVDACLIAIGVAREVDVKRIAVAGVVVERRRKLEIQDVREFKLRTYLPSQQESIVVWDKLSFACDRLRRRRASTYWILRVRIVVNKLPKVCEEIEL